MESHNQDEPLKTITEGLYLRAFFDEILNDSGKIRKELFDGRKFNETLLSAFIKDPKQIDECLKAIDLVDNDKRSEEARRSLINLRKQLVILKERIAEENREGAEESSEENSERTESTSEQ